MKKNRKKLTLTRETMRNLSDTSLRDVAAGAITDFTNPTCAPNETCPHTCMDTCPVHSCVDTTCPPCVG